MRNKLLFLAFGIMLVLSGCVQQLGATDGSMEDISLSETSAEEGNIKKAETTINNFIAAISTQAYTGIKDYIYMPDNSFVSDDDVKWYISRSALGDITGTGKTVDSIEVNGSTLEKTGTFSIGKSTYSLDLTLGDDNTWKVILPDFLAENFSLRVPGGCSVTVDNVDIANYKNEALSSTDTTYETYSIPSLALKEHDVIVTSSLYGDFSLTVTPKSSSDTYTCICKIGDAETTNVLKAIQTIWNGIYTDYKAGADVPAIKKYFVTEFDTNTLTNILTKQLPALEKGTSGLTYSSFYMSLIQPYTKDNYGAVILASDNSLLCNFMYKTEFTDSEGGYHSCNKISQLTVCYENGTYKLQALNDEEIFTDNDFNNNDF